MKSGETMMFTTLGRCKPKTKRCDKEVCDNHKYDYHMDETHFNIKGLKRISFPSPPEELLLLTHS